MPDNQPLRQQIIDLVAEERLSPAVLVCRMSCICHRPMGNDPVTIQAWMWTLINEGVLALDSDSRLVVANAT